MPQPVAFLFPGQGSQAVGMGRALCERFALARAVFDEADDTLGFALSRLCFDGPLEELTLTENTQPALLTTSTALARVLAGEFGLQPAWAAGHSLGEFSALVAAGALQFRDAVRVVRERGLAMQAAVPAGQGGMAALMGMDLDAVESLCREAAEGETLAPANLNGAGQVVIAGSAGAVARAVTLAPQRGAKRAVPLNVSAPFHCALMQPAADRLQAVLSDIEIHPLRCPVIANVDAAPNQDHDRVRGLLVQQVCSPVRWEESIRTLAGLGCERAIEVGPGRVLAALVKRIAPSIAIASGEDLDAAQAMVTT